MLELVDKVRTAVRRAMSSSSPTGGFADLMRSIRQLKVELESAGQMDPAAAVAHLLKVLPEWQGNKEILLVRGVFERLSSERDKKIAEVLGTLQRQIISSSSWLVKAKAEIIAARPAFVHSCSKQVVRTIGELESLAADLGV